MRMIAGIIWLFPGLWVMMSSGGAAFATSPNANTSSFESGIAAYKAANHAEARRVWSGLAVMGHTLAQYNLGIMYFDSGDYGLARKWFGSAARSAFAPAFVNLAMMHQHGYGARKNPELALAHLIVAADALPPGRCRTSAVERKQAILSSLPAKALVYATRMANATLRPSESKYSYYSFAGECFESIALGGGTIGAIAQISGFSTPASRRPAAGIPDRSVASDIATRETAAERRDPPRTTAMQKGRVVAAKRDAGAAPAVRRWTYFAQVASLPTNEAARRFQSRLQSRHPGVLDGQEMAIQEAQVENLGTVYRVRVGPFGEKTEAKGVCRALKEQRQDCFVVRQGKAEG